MIAAANAREILLPDWAEFLFRPSRYKIIHGGRGSSKCLGIGTPVLMFDGTIRAVEDIEVGDRVMGPDSAPRLVLSTTQGTSELYEVAQSSAMTYVVNADHILSLRKSKSCVLDTGGRMPDWPDVTNIGLQEYLAQSDRWKGHFRGYRKDKLLSQVTVTAIGPGAYAGFAVDGDHLFCLADGTVTHNSWTVARTLLLKAASEKRRVLCGREIQKSIKDSVHKLLSDQIGNLGLTSFYQVLDTEIRGINGSEFIFTGLSNQTIDSVKSFEGIDDVWIEEGQTISKRSLEILIPTIRKPKSEINITLNPELDTDAVYARFIVDPPPGAIVKAVNYHDNPWFPEVLEQERLLCLTRNPEEYPTIWEGKCRSAVVGAIYATEVAQLLSQQRHTTVPYDPQLKVHTIWDLGWNDSMVILLVQRGGMGDLRLIGYLEENFKTLDWYAGILRAMPLNWGYDWLPHDGDTKDFKTGKSAAEILKAFGRRTRKIPNIGIETGIKAFRMALPKLWVAKGWVLPNQPAGSNSNTARFIECMKRYRRSVPVVTGEPGTPVHDEFSHGADAGRYLGVVADMLKNDEIEAATTIPTFTPMSRSCGY